MNVEASSIMYSNTLECRTELDNRVHWNIRPLRRGEDRTIRELCARLSLRTRYLRFLVPMPVVPDSLVHMLANVDDPRRLALVAEVNDGDGNNVVGLANVGGIDDDHAELGLVVADAWQRRGIGLALATEALRAAEGRGYQRFVVHAFSDNAALRPFLSHLANVVSRTTRRGVSEITFVLRESAAAPLGAIRRWPTTPADELLEKAYERILAAKGGTGPY
jgi:RimJ/RimL family protein N-acetyltransferase